MPSEGWRTSTGGRVGAAIEKSAPTSASRNGRDRSLVSCGFEYRGEDVGGTRQNRFLQIRTVRDRRIERADTLDGRIEVFEQLARHARGQLRAEPACDLILVRDHD